jgi:hypothetical protein
MIFVRFCFSFLKRNKYTSENTEGAIKNRQSRETGKIGYTRRRKTKENHNTLCVEHHYT